MQRNDRLTEAAGKETTMHIRMFRGHLWSVAVLLLAFGMLGTAVVRAAPEG